MALTPHRHSANTCGVALRETTEAIAEMPQRIKTLLEERNMSQSELARRIGVRNGTVSDLLSGKTVPGTDTLLAVCEVLGAHPTFVMLGVGPKYRSDADELEPAPVEVRNATHGIDQWLGEHPEVTEDERAWMRAVPWPVAHVKQSDLVYLTMLSVYRQAREAKPARTVSVAQTDSRRP